MAANKFASMLHKNCHKIIVILVYAVLEWILILLLFLNSFFSYLIAKFAKFFGLKPSCTWCSRLDHVFDSQKIAKNPHFDHVCEAHGSKISKMSYCTTHKKLAESKSLCIHCSSPTPAAYGTMNDISSTVAFFTWMSTQNASEGGDQEENLCSCCDQILTTKVYPQSLIFNPTWDILLEHIHKNKIAFEGDPVKKEAQLQENGGHDHDGANADQRAFEKDDEQKLKSEIVEDSNVGWNSSDDNFLNQGRCNEDEEESVYIADMLLQNAELMDDSDRFICIELIDTEDVAAATENSSENVDQGRDDNDEEQGQGLLLEEASQFHTVSNSASQKEEYHKISDYEQKDYKLAEDSIKIEHESSSSNREQSERVGEGEEKGMEALYAELEEERKAAEEAAMETMAMITKLQEEKAAIQMEALQYQRMMEEQAEYDQEALQLLNHLILKRDKENKHLHNELETYRAKVFDYEQGREDIVSREGSQNGGSDDSDSDSDSDSVTDYDPPHHNEMEEETEADISLTEFDEERVSILQEVKVLEGKLLMHGDEAKPLFDERQREEMSIETTPKMLLEEEIGHVYERLQALEADKDFLNHCIRNIIKGDQGMALVQEILHHLRDLKSLQYTATATNVDISLSDASVAKQDHQHDNSLGKNLLSFSKCCE